MAKARKKASSRIRNKKKGQSEETADSAAIMSECVALCQEERWREALRLCSENRQKADKQGNRDIAQSLAGAEAKIQYSLRRQMINALVCSAKDLLAKEYLLDVEE